VPLRCLHCFNMQPDSLRNTRQTVIHRPVRARINAPTPAQTPTCDKTQRKSSHFDPLVTKHQSTTMPSSDEGSLSRWSQFIGHRDVFRPKRSSSLERNAEVPHADVNDYREYLRCLRLQAKELQDGVQGLGGFREASHELEQVRKCLDETVGTAERRDSAAEIR
jgi:hypothetical protein